jgi:hypothetical protein
MAEKRGSRVEASLHYVARPCLKHTYSKAKIVPPILSPLLFSFFFLFCIGPKISCICPTTSPAPFLHFHRGNDYHQLFLKMNLAKRCWLMPIILANQEAEIRRIEIQSQAGQIVCEMLSLKHPTQKRAGGMAHVVYSLLGMHETVGSILINTHTHTHTHTHRILNGSQEKEFVKSELTWIMKG